MGHSNLADITIGNGYHVQPVTFRRTLTSVVTGIKYSIDNCRLTNISDNGLHCHRHLANINGNRLEEAVVTSN